MVVTFPVAAEFLKTSLTKFASHLFKKDFVPDKLENHTSKGKGKEKRRARRKHARRRRGNGCTLSFYNCYLAEDLKKGCETEKVHFSGYVFQNPAKVPFGKSTLDIIYR